MKRVHPLRSMNVLIAISIHSVIGISCIKEDVSLDSSKKVNYIGEMYLYIYTHI